MLVVVDGETPALAREVTDVLAAEFEAMGETFRDVYVPGGGAFFEDNALLYRTPDELDVFADQLVARVPAPRPAFTDRLPAVAEAQLPTACPTGGLAGLEPDQTAIAQLQRASALLRSGHAPACSDCCGTQSGRDKERSDRRSPGIEGGLEQRQPHERRDRHRQSHQQTERFEATGPGPQLQQHLLFGRWRSVRRRRGFVHPFTLVWQIGPDSDDGPRELQTRRSLGFGQAQPSPGDQMASSRNVWCSPPSRQMRWVAER